MSSEFILDYPPLPSWQRYRTLFSGIEDTGLLRRLQYEALSTARYGATILDFGGGDKAHYRPMLSDWSNGATYHSANIAEFMEPTYIVAVGEPLPIAPESYDTVVCFNTLEHIYNPATVLNDMFRVTKPSGNLVAVVPFMYRYHPSPEDFTRMSPNWFATALGEIGYEKITVTPQYWGPFSAGSSASGQPGPLKKWRFHAALMTDIAFAKARMKNGGTTYDDPNGRGWLDFALGYMVQASRPATG